MKVETKVEVTMTVTGEEAEILLGAIHTLRSRGVYSATGQTVGLEDKRTLIDMWETLDASLPGKDVR